MLRLSVMGGHVFTHRGRTGDYDHNFYDWLKRQPGCNRALMDTTNRDVSPAWH